MEPISEVDNYFYFGHKQGYFEVTKGRNALRKNSVLQEALNSYQLLVLKTIIYRYIKIHKNNAVNN
jgi:hypothetical protein